MGKKIFVSSGFGNKKSFSGSGGGGGILAGDNVGSGEGEVFKDISAATMHHRTLKAGEGIVVSTETDTVDISAIPSCRYLVPVDDIYDNTVMPPSYYDGTTRYIAGTTANGWTQNNIYTSKVFTPGDWTYPGTTYYTRKITPVGATPAPVEILLGWWAGENDLYDSVNDLTMVHSGGSLLYATGFVGDCFNIGNPGPLCTLDTPVSALLDTPASGTWKISCYIKKPMGSFPLDGGVNITRRDGSGVIWTLASASTDGNIVLGLPSGSQTYYFDLTNDWTLITVTYVNGRWDVYFGAVKQTPLAGYQDQTVAITGGYYEFTPANNNGDCSIDEIKIYKTV